MRATTLGAPPQDSPSPRMLIAAVGAVALHAVLLAALSRAPVSAATHASPVELEVVEVPRPAPAPVPVQPDPPPKIVPTIRHFRHISKPVAPPPPTLAQPTPPPPNTPAPPSPPAPIAIGLSLSSTAKSGSFAAPVGNTLYGKPPDHASRPDQVRPYGIPADQKYVPSYQVSDPPVLVGDFKPPYPDAARKAGIEGQVTLKLLIDASGHVTRATLLRGGGNGFDEAALVAAPHLRFRPATLAGDPVATEITYVMTFLLD